MMIVLQLGMSKPDSTIVVAISTSAEPFENDSMASSMASPSICPCAVMICKFGKRRNSRSHGSRIILIRGTM